VNVGRGFSPPPPWKGGLKPRPTLQSLRVIRILVLAIAVLAAFVPFVPVILVAATLTLSALVVTRTLGRTKTRCDDQPVALLALVSFRAPPAFV